MRKASIIDSMDDRIVNVRHRSQRPGYEILITRSRLQRSGEWVKSCINEPAEKTVIVSNPKVFSLYGETVRKSLKAAGFDVSVWLMKDGERYKNLRSLESALKFFSSERVSRNDVVVALGGGVVGWLRFRKKTSSTKQVGRGGSYAELSDEHLR